MKKTILSSIVTLICVLILASCGTASTSSSVGTTTAATTAVVTTTTAVVTTLPTTTIALTTVITTTTEPTTAKPHTTARKTEAKTVKQTSQNKTTAKKKAQTTEYKKNAGLSDADVLWAQAQANEYLQTLKGVKLDKSAEGYTLSSGIPDKCTTKEKLLERLKEDIDCDYESSLEADWHEMGMYVKMEKNKVSGNWVYKIMNVCYG